MNKENRYEDTCPWCEKGKNDKGDGGTIRCFHCDRCGFVECEFFSFDDLFGSVYKKYRKDKNLMKRLKDFYEK